VICLWCERTALPAHSCSEKNILRRCLPPVLQHTLGWHLASLTVIKWEYSNSSPEASVLWLPRELNSSP
jgi:hypothetical protein